MMPSPLLNILILFHPPRRYPYFDVVVGLAWSHDPESSAGGRVVTGRLFHARYDPDKKGYPAL
jgi:hypothetical protein